jgi:adenylate cyclase
MPIVRKYPFTSYLKGRWYRAIAVALTCAVWSLLALSVYPLMDRDGSYATNPYGLATGLENQALDLLFQLRNARRPQAAGRGLNEPITIIEVDEAAIKATGFRPETWGRNMYARLVDRASEGGATIIGLDLLLSEAGGPGDDHKAWDQELADSIASARNVVLAMKAEGGGFGESRPLCSFAEAAYSIGYADIPLDRDGFLRSVQLFRPAPEGGQHCGVKDEKTQYSFATRVTEGYLTLRAYAQKLAALRAQGMGEEQAADEAGLFAQQIPPLTLEADGTASINGRRFPLRNDLFLQLDFRGRTPSFRRISAKELLTPGAKVPEDLFRDRIVLIGAAYVTASDLFPTPFYEASPLARLVNRNLPTAPVRTPGVELHATTVATLLFGNALARPTYIWQLAALVLPLVLAALAVFNLRAFLALLVVLLIAVGLLVVSSWAFNSYGLILPLASAWLGIAVLTPLGLGLRYAHEQTLRTETERERAQVMDIFSRFVSGEVAEEIWERRGERSLAGENRVVTIIFTDIRSFTTLSEAVPSDRVVQWLNDYFARMHRIVEAHGGHINKYLGDGLMIVFGAPADRGAEIEARAAVDCGLAMLKAVEELNEEWKELNRPIIKIGVGIHTGEATCGVIGAERRLEYTVIGDVVNLAARLEATTKDLDVPILLSENTARLLGEGYAVRPLGEVKVKGKTINTSVYTIEPKENNGS